MTPDDLKKYFGNSYQFEKQTKMSGASYRNWMKWGYVPEGSQYKIQRLTKGALIAEWKDDDENKPGED